MKKSFLLFLFSILAIHLLGQKPEKVKYEGYFNNIPSYKLDISGYSVSTSVSPYVEKVMAESKISLELKGFERGDGLKIILIINDPKVDASVVEETKKSMGQQEAVTKYFTKISATAESNLLILNKEGLPIWTFKTEPDHQWIDKTGFDRNSYSEAAKELSAAEKSSAEYVKKKYTEKLIAAYQNELDNYFGIFVRKQELRLFTLKAKKFDYSDFNQATLKFQKATESSEINSDETRQVIEEFITVCEIYAGEYQSGKKSKVSDVNYNAINYNIMAGYLALGDGEKLTAYWNKCLKIRGNGSAEGSAKRYVPQMIENYEMYLAKKENPLKPIDLITEDQKYNEMILLKGFINHYLTQKHGNLGVIADYMPAQHHFISSVRTTKTFDEGTKETLTLSYQNFGQLKGITYQNEGGLSDSKTYNFTFDYTSDGISRIMLSGDHLVFSVAYEAGRITEVTRHYSNTQKVKYRLQQKSPGEVGVKAIVVTDGTEKEGMRNHYIKYNEICQITAIYLDPFLTKALKYDEYGNIVKLTAVNMADNEVSLKFSIETDTRGNIVKATGMGCLQESEYQYLF